MYPPFDSAISVWFLPSFRASKSHPVQEGTHVPCAEIPLLLLIFTVFKGKTASCGRLASFGFRMSLTCTYMRVIFIFLCVWESMCRWMGWWGCEYALIHSLSLSLSLSLSFFLSPLPLSHTDTHAHRQTRTHMHAYTFTCAPAHTHKHVHTSTHLPWADSSVRPGPCARDRSPAE